MKNIDFYIRIGLFTLNPTIEIYENNVFIDKKKTDLKSLTKDILGLSSKYQGRVDSIRLFGAKTFLTKFYKELSNHTFAMQDIKITINEEKKI